MNIGVLGVSERNKHTRHGCLVRTHATTTMIPLAGDVNSTNYADTGACVKDSDV